VFRFKLRVSKMKDIADLSIYRNPELARRGQKERLGVGQAMPREMV
jgi:hypothetical protein